MAADGLVAADRGSWSLVGRLKVQHEYKTTLLTSRGDISVIISGPACIRNRWFPDDSPRRQQELGWAGADSRCAASGAPAMSGRISYFKWPLIRPLRIRRWPAPKSTSGDYNCRNQLGIQTRPRPSRLRRLLLWLLLWQELLRRRGSGGQGDAPAFWRRGSLAVAANSARRACACACAEVYACIRECVMVTVWM